MQFLYKHNHFQAQCFTRKRKNKTNKICTIDTNFEPLTSQESDSYMEVGISMVGNIMDNRVEKETDKCTINLTIQGRQIEVLWIQVQHIIY